MLKGLDERVCDVGFNEFQRIRSGLITVAI